MTELAVLVPVLNRPQNVAPLVESFLAGCPENSVLGVETSRGDDAEINEWVRVVDKTGLGRAGRFSMISVDPPGTWPQKINAHVELLTANQSPLYEAEWVLCAADDIRFTEGWWDATLRLRQLASVGVIGTNDSKDGTGNPRVAAGEHTCHPLIRASYIQAHGTIDESGKAVHDGYAHSFVDDELVLTAKMRNAWAFCPEAVIEHIHPWWTQRPEDWDATYEKGQSTFQTDRAVFAERVKLLGLELAP